MHEFIVSNVPATASLGYSLYLAGVAVGSRVTAGITPVGIGTGVYRAVIDDTICDLVVWDTGGSRPVYSTEEIYPAEITPTIGGASVIPILGGGPVTVISPILGAR